MSSRATTPVNVLPQVARSLSIPRVDPATLGAVIAFVSLLVVALFGERLAPHESIFFVVEHGPRA